MDTVFKYKLGLELPETVISMPKWAQVLYTASQGMELFIWAIVEPANPSEDRVFIVRGTGHPFSGNEGSYIGTAIMMDGALVLHVFEHN